MPTHSVLWARLSNQKRNESSYRSYGSQQAGQGPAGLLSVGFVCITKEYVCDFGRIHSSLVPLENFLIQLQPHSEISFLIHHTARNVRVTNSTHKNTLLAHGSTLGKIRSETMSAPCLKFVHNIPLFVRFERIFFMNKVSLVRFLQFRVSFAPNLRFSLQFQHF